MSHHKPISLIFDDLDPLDQNKLPKDPKLAAAVLIAITEKSDPEIIFTRRADHLNSHSGQVSFPGGRWEQQDKNLEKTALRESHEEIGLLPGLVSMHGRISPRPSKDGLFVQPYVGTVPRNVDVKPNPDEIASIFRVPLSYFEANKPDRVDKLSRHGVGVRVPAWDFQGYDIWGLTAMFTLDLLKRLKIKIDMTSVPERELGH